MELRPNPTVPKPVKLPRLKRHKLRGGCDENVNTSVTGGDDNECNIKGSKNCNFHGDNNSLEFTSSTQTQFTGYRNTMKCTNEVNLGFNGADNKCTFTGNTGSTIAGSHNTLTLTENSNARIFGNSNTIMATRNINLIVDGNFNQIDSINDTTNHTLKILENGNTRNKINISAQYPQRTASNNPGATAVNGFEERRLVLNVGDFIQPFIVSIEYVKKVSNEWNQYRVGIFQFYMKQHGESTKARFKATSYDAGTLDVTVGEILTDQGWKLTISGSFNGERETLEFLAPPYGSSYAKETNGNITLKIQLYFQVDPRLGTFPQVQVVRVEELFPV